MITASVKSALVAKINALDTFEVKPFIKPAFDVSKAGDDEYFAAYMAEFSQAKAKHDAESGAPSESSQIRFAAIELLSEVYKNDDSKDFGEKFNILKSMVQNRIGLTHFSEGDFDAEMKKALRGEVSAITQDKAKAFLAFVNEVNPEARNFSALTKANRFTGTLAKILTGPMVFQNLTLKTKEEIEASTLDISEALNAISKGLTLYKVTPKEEATPAPKQSKKGNK